MLITPKQLRLRGNCACGRGAIALAVAGQLRLRSRQEGDALSNWKVLLKQYGFLLRRGLRGTFVPLLVTFY